MNKRKTSFIVAGAKRSGHASIYHCLSQHPLVHLLSPDRSGYFAADHLHENGTPRHSQYENLYDHHRTLMTNGEVCSHYLSHHSAISRMYHYNPNLKIIVCLRNPAERAYSHWQDATTQGVEKRTFRDAISNELALTNDGDQSTPSSSPYLAQSRYSNQIDYLCQYFDPHQLLFIKSEDLRDDTEVMLFQMMQFLSVPYTEVDCSAQNIGSYSRSMSSEDYMLVTDALKDDVLKTEAQLGWRCSDWLQTPAPLRQHIDQRIHEPAI